MAKTTVRDWSTTASDNTDLNSTGIQGTNAVSNFDNALRELMKQIADVDKGSQPLDDTFSVCDPADATKRVRIDAGSVSAGQTRVITMPDANVALSPNYTSVGTNNTVSGFTAFSNADYATGGDIARFAPTDWGVGKHGLYVTKIPALSYYRFGIWDGLNNNGTIEISSATLTWNGNTIWSSGNDGASSGLDADLLDGQHGSYYTNASNISSGTLADGRLPTTQAGKTWSSLSSFAAATFATGGDNTRFIPSDWGVGKPGIFVNQTPGTDRWNMGLWDGATGNGSFRLSGQTLWLDYTGTLLIGDSGTENFRFNSDALLSNGMTVTKTAINDTGTGVSIHQAGIIWVSRDGLAPMFLNRDTSDGTLAQFGRSKTAVGSISVTATNTTYNTSSDGRAKINRQPLATAGAVIDALEPLTWDWSHTEGETGVGFIAQDLQSVVPEAVTPGDGDSSLRPGDEGFEWWGVDMSKLVPYLVAEVKALRARVASLEEGGPVV